MSVLNIPTELQDHPRWVVHTESKRPKRAQSPTEDASSTNPDTWATFGEAVSTWQAGKAAGVGYVLGEGVVGIDLDYAFDGDTLKPEAQKVIDMLPPTHIEKSPSGNGLHAYVRGTKAPDTKCKTDIGNGCRLEVYDAGRYFTVTGDTWNDAPPSIADADLTELCKLLAINDPPKASTPSPPPASTDDAFKRCVAYIKKIPDAVTGNNGHDRTLQAACECYRFGLNDADAMRALEWFNANKCSPPWQAHELDHKLKDARAKVEGKGEIGTRLDGLSDKTPYDTAKKFVAEFYDDGHRTLHHWRDDFHAYTGTHYKPIALGDISEQLYKFTEPHFAPNQNRISNIIHATKAATNLSDDIETPEWLTRDDNRRPAAEWLPMANGVLHLVSRVMMPHTSELFSLNALTFDYDPRATCPEWLAFLDSVWGDEPEQIETLQEWMGYLISGKTDQQKIALVVGPKRSGKGTIIRIITQLLGADNCCNPTLNSLSQNFGMAPLINKMSAIISDARLGGKADQHTISERMLNTSGEDPQTIDRKFREPWSGKLRARISIMSNELPRLADSSGALSSRFVVMMMTKSFYGCEDLALGGRLMSELPGIFNWSLEGMDRLEDRGHFIQPESSQDAIEELQDLTSPISAFVRDCIKVGPTDMPPRCDTVYDAWVTWCEEQGRTHPGTSATFGRDLRAAVPEVRSVRTGKNVPGGRARVYQGISLIE